MVITAMFDDFIIRAVLAGFGVALIAGPLGCLIVWRRMAYFGDTLAHSALLGVALAFLMQIWIVPAVFVCAVAISLGLLVLERRTNVSSDALLGLLSHASLAIGLVTLALIPGAGVDIEALLFGDVLAVNRSDLILIWGAAAMSAPVLFVLWRNLFASSVSKELAEAEGAAPERSQIIFMVLTALAIALAMKVTGVLLITAMLILPAATARAWSTGPEIMVVLAIIVGCLSVILGMAGSLVFDTPSGPSIVVGAFLLFLLSLVPLRMGGRSR